MANEICEGGVCHHSPLLPPSRAIATCMLSPRSVPTTRAVKFFCSCCLVSRTDMRIARILQGGEIMLDHCILVKTALLLFVGLLLCFSQRRRRGENRGHQVLLLRPQNPPPLLPRKSLRKETRLAGSTFTFWPSLLVAGDTSVAKTLQDRPPWFMTPPTSTPYPPFYVSALAVGRRASTSLA